MNRPSPTAPHPTGVADMSAAPSGDDLSPPERLSALVDGELDAAGEAALWGDDTTVLGETWARYQLIGDALRGNRAQAPDAARVAAIMLHVRQEQQRQAASADVAPPAPTQLAPAPAQAMVAVPHDAANDAVFRWKMLAGFASLAAVVAVAWNMNATLDAGGPQLAQGTSGTVIAVTAPASSTVSAPAQRQAGAPVLSASTAAAPAVVAEASQGPVLRDARLEELMAAHRQAGGMSALQMPAGFLRNAAFDLPEGQR